MDYLDSHDEIADKKFTDSIIPFVKNEEGSELLVDTPDHDGEDDGLLKRKITLLKEKERGLVEDAQERMLEQQLKEEQADEVEGQQLAESDDIRANEAKEGKLADAEKIEPEDLSGIFAKPSETLDDESKIE